MLLAEELVLLLLDDDSGRWLVRRPAVRAAVRVGLVVELLARRTLSFDDSGVLVDGLTGTTGGDPLLDATARQAAGQPLATALKPDRGELPQLLRRLRGRGVLRRAPVRRRRHLARDRHPEAAVRARLLEALTVRLRPDRHTALLVALVFELDLLGTLFPDQDRLALSTRAATITSELRTDLHYFPTSLEEEARVDDRSGGRLAGAGEVLGGIGDALEVLDAVGDLLKLVSLPVRLAIRVLDGWP